MQYLTYPYDFASQFIQKTTTLSKLEPDDVLVKIKAVSVNPIDTKVKLSVEKDKQRILGWDASGIIVNVGSNVKGLKKGDAVYYAGSLNRDGSNAEYQIVDSRFIAKKPDTFTHAESAALPLTSLTAYEGLYDRLNISKNKGDNRNKSILIINGAGGVGSMAIQLAKHAGLKVIASASRDETKAWALKMGADEIVNHHEDYKIDPVDYIYCLHTPDPHIKKMATLIKPFGKICAIVDSKKPLDMNILKSKSISFSWEFMFTHGNFNQNIEHQGDILKEIANMVDHGILKSTLYQTLSPLSPESLNKAHEIIESNQSIGKLVIETENAN